jgi:hypothetical protein
MRKNKRTKNIYFKSKICQKKYKRKKSIYNIKYAKNLKKKTKIIYMSRQMKITAIKQILMNNSVKNINRPN